jgi:hypothetical protein
VKGLILITLKYDYPQLIPSGNPSSLMDPFASMAVFLPERSAFGQVKPNRLVGSSVGLDANDSQRSATNVSEIFGKPPFYSTCLAWHSQRPIHIGWNCPGIPNAYEILAAIPLSKCCQYAVLKSQDLPVVYGTYHYGLMRSRDVERCY